MDHKAHNQCELCYQFSHSGSASYTGLCVVLYMLACGTVLLTVFGNLLVIISICCFKHLHTPTNLILLSLAVADLLVGVTVMPFHFSVLIESTWHFGTAVCSVFSVFACVLTYTSVYNVVFIAVDRYFAVHNPFLYNTKMTVRVSLLVISFIWICSIIYSVSVLYFNGIFKYRIYSTCAAECVVILNETSYIINVIYVFCVPCFVIVFLYVHVFAIARKHIVTITRHRTAKNTEKSHSVASERKAAMKLGVLVVGFLLCFVPCYITVFVSFKVSHVSVRQAFLYTLVLVSLNSTVNPIIYALVYPWFRKCVKHILATVLCISNTCLLNVPPSKRAAASFAISR